MDNEFNSCFDNHSKGLEKIINEKQTKIIENFPNFNEKITIQENKLHNCEEKQAKLWKQLQNLTKLKQDSIEQEISFKVNEKLKELESQFEEKLKIEVTKRQILENQTVSKEIEEKYNQLLEKNKELEEKLSKLSKFQELDFKTFDDEVINTCFDVNLLKKLKNSADMISQRIKERKKTVKSQSQEGELCCICWEQKRNVLFLPFVLFFFFDYL